MSLKAIAEQYFSSINSIALRLSSDLTETKAAYDKLWLNLTEEEQNQILNESIIKPEACLQYNSISCDYKKKEEYAAKTIIDDNCSYRDEHSAPFSYRTPSQRNLTIFETDSLFNTPNESFEAVNNSDLTKINTVYNNENCWSDDSKSYSSSVPKTGLDFLDNW